MGGVFASTTSAASPAASPAASTVITPAASSDGVTWSDLAMAWPPQRPWTKQSAAVNVDSVTYARATAASLNPTLIISVPGKGEWVLP